MIKAQSTGLPTPLDIQHASFYAQSRIIKEKCLSPEMAKENPGLYWEPKPQNSPFACPKGVEKCEYGHCKIGNKDTCLAQSYLPWNKLTGVKNPAPTGATGAAKPYLEWREGKPGKCIFGDYYLRYWCNWPKHRDTKSVPGVTDVPPFNYCSNVGQCLMSDPYCHWMEVDFRGATGEEACQKYPSDLPHCHETEGQKIAEQFFFGKTIFRLAKRTLEGFKNDPPPNKVSKMMDKKMMAKYVNIGPNFGGPGINLYSIQWKPDAIFADDQIIVGGTIGFLTEEVEKKYPKFVKTRKGLKWIEIDRNNIKDKNMKRIYFVCTSGRWMLNSLSSFIKSKKKM